MKTNALISRLNTLFITIVLVYACKKSITDYTGGSTGNPSGGNPTTGTGKDSTGVQSADSIPFPITVNFDCIGPDYGDSIVYPQPTPTFKDYTVQPLNNPGTGKYMAWPGGLQIDPNTGVIDITRSVNGVRYTIGFVKQGSSDTCLRNLILGGAAFMDSVYVLGNNQKFANPYFDANPSVPSMCSSSSPSGSGCKWDINGAAKLQNIVIDNNTGIIDLYHTLGGGAFGPAPLNGTTIQSTIAYQLSGPSNMAIQQATIQLMYYDKKSNIPQSVLNQINTSRNNILQDLLISLSGGKPRPPLLVITRSN